MPGWLRRRGEEGDIQGLVGFGLGLGWLAWDGMGWDGWDGIHIHGLAWVLRLGSYEMHCWKGYQAVASSMALALFFAVSFALGMLVLCGWRWMDGGYHGCCISGCSLFVPLLGPRPSPACTWGRQASSFPYTEYTFTCFVSQDNLSNQLTVIGGSWGFHLLRSSSLCYGPPYWPELHPPAAAWARCIGRHEDHPGILLSLRSPSISVLTQSGASRGNRVKLASNFLADACLSIPLSSHYVSSAVS